MYHYYNLPHFFSVTLQKSDSSDNYEKLAKGSEQCKQKQNKPVSIGHQNIFLLIHQISIVIYWMSSILLDYKDIKANNSH